MTGQSGLFRADQPDCVRCSNGVRLNTAEGGPKRLRQAWGLLTEDEMVSFLVATVHSKQTKMWSTSLYLDKWAWLLRCTVTLSCHLFSPSYVLVNSIVVLLGRNEMSWTRPCRWELLSIEVGPNFLIILLAYKTNPAIQQFHPTNIFYKSPIFSITASH